jgi:hypothetical protein
VRSKRGWRPAGPSRRSKPGRWTAALAVGALTLGACSSTSHSRVQAPAEAGPGAALSGGTTTTTSAAISGPSTTASQPTADATHIRALLVGAKDLPSGFTAAPDTEAGDDSIGLSPCGRLVLPVAGATAQARAAFDRNGSQEQVVEQVATLDGSDAAALVAQVRQVGVSCPQFDRTNAGTTVTLQVTPLHPPPVGQEVGGAPLGYSARFFDVVVVRSGQVDAVLILSEVGNPFPPTTMQAVVTAAGAKLTAGLGG